VDVGWNNRTDGFNDCDPGREDNLGFVRRDIEHVHFG